MSITLNPMSSGSVVAAETRSSEEFQRMLIDGFASIFDNRKVVAVAGTRETLAASTACKKVIITAETDNTGIVVVGGSTVVAALATRRGIPLYAGDTIVLEVDNLADINLDVTVSGDGVTYAYFV